MIKKNAKESFAVCISSKPSEDLETWKVYRVLPDESATKIGRLRVIDESGEDYLYPANRFVMLELSASARQQLIAAKRPRE